MRNRFVNSYGEKFNSITAQGGFRAKSFEELRFEDITFKSAFSCFTKKHSFEKLFSAEGSANSEEKGKELNEEKDQKENQNAKWSPTSPSYSPTSPSCFPSKASSAPVSDGFSENRQKVSILQHFRPCFSLSLNAP